MCDKAALRPRRRCGLAGQDRRELVDVDLAERALPRSDLLLEARDELRAKDVDLAVQQAAAIRDLLLLVLEIVDERLQVGVGQGYEIRKRFHSHLSSEWS